MSVWPKVKLGEVLAQYREYIDAPEQREYKKLSVKLYGKGVSMDTPVDGTSLKMQRHQIAKAGQIILSEIWGKKGAIGFVPSEGEGALCTSHFFLFDINKEKLDPRWIKAIFAANYLEGQLGADAKGTTGYAAVRPKTLLSCVIPLPPLPEQRRVVARIEELSAQIQEARTIRKQEKLQIQQMLTSAFFSIAKEAPRKPMSEIAPLVRRPVEISMNATYPELGIRSFGKGAFHKPALSGFDLGAKRIFEIKKGDLLFSNVFAWEGAIAVARTEDDGRFGSHRFMTCVPKEGVSTSPFLCFYFLTDEGMELIRAASPGGAGRNRTLGIQALLDIKAPVPSFEKQKWFDALQAQVDALKRLQAGTAAELDALLPAILDRAFKGQL